MLVVVLGSTGRIGRHVVDEALRRGFDVRATTRGGARAPGRPRLTLAPLDLEDPTSIEAAIRDANAVVGCLGPKSNSADQVGTFRAAARRLVEAMDRQRIPRLVLLSGAGVRRAGDQRGRGDAILAAIVGRAARHVVAAKQAEFETIAASDLDWTALRPPLVIDGAATGRYRLSVEGPPLGARVTRADVGAALVDQLLDDRWIGKAPFVWTPRGDR